MDDFQKEIKEWADATFGFNGVQSTIASLHHLSGEVEELREAVVSRDITRISQEHADCLIILLHTALNYGLTFSDIVKAAQLKMEINKSREWGGPDERGVVNHMKQIEFMAGQSLENAHQALQTCGEPCFGEFNGKKIYSTDTLDEAYVKVTGVSKAESDERERKEHDEHERKEAEHKDKIPQLTDEYRARARGIIPDDKLELWDSIVPIRLNDLYHGMELDCWLELITELNSTENEKEERFRLCGELFIKQGHSGMSAGLVSSGLKQLHPLGTELVEYINTRR